MRWRGSPSVVAGLIFVMGGLAHACGGKAVDDNGGRSGLGEAGGSAGNGNTSSGNASGTTSTGGSSTGSGNGSAQGGASPPGYGQGGANVSTGGAYTMPWPGAGGTVAVGGFTNTDPMCLGVSRDMVCPVEGYMCPWLRCGLADQGSRDCYCANGVWNCTSCDFTGSVIEYPPPNMPTCTIQADQVACDTEWALCQGAPAAEVCACYLDEYDGLIWDCDDPPSTWP